MKVPELLAPAGDIVSLKAALQGGADAVYIGIKGLNMRAGATNFEMTELKKVADLVHKENKKVYLALNTIIYDGEEKKVERLLKAAKEAKIDAVICWDMAVITKASELGIPVHLSTQASVSNSESAKAFKRLGVERIILARECTLEQIKHIKDNVDIELEVFAHGAMCVAVSGRCLTSQFLHGKSANRGECIQPCRREYQIRDPEEGHDLVLGNDYVMSPKDLCSIPFLDNIVETGVDALKIEGRNRSPEYVKTVVSVYREALDMLRNGKLPNDVKVNMLKRLKTVYTRGFSRGFFFGSPGPEEFTRSYGSMSTVRKEYVGKIRNFYNQIDVAEIKVESTPFKKGDDLLIQGPTTGVIEQKAESIQKNHEDISLASKGERVAIKTVAPVRPGDKVFRTINKIN